MNKELQTKLQNHFKHNDSLTLYKKDGTPKVFSKKYSIVFNSKYESFNFTDYDKFIDFANKHSMTFADNKEKITIDAVLIKLKKHNRINICSRKNGQCFVMEIDKYTRTARRELEGMRARIIKLDTIIQKLYEDNVDGKISDERFAKLSATYEIEQKDLQAKVIEIEKTIGDESKKIIDVNYFLDLAKKYYDIQKLDCEIIRTFIEKVIVHKAEKIDGKRCQRIEIKYIGIGSVAIPN